MIPYHTGSKRQPKRKNEVRKGKATKEATVKNNGKLWKRQRGWKQWQQRGENKGGWAEAKFGSFRLQLSPACKMADKEKHEKSSGAYIWDDFTLDPTQVPAFSCLQLCCKTAILGFCQTYFHTESCFQIYFHIESFPNLLSHRKCFQIYFHTESFF